MNHRVFPALGMTLVMACGAELTTPAGPIALAKGGPNAVTTAPISMSLDAGSDVFDDGKGAYTSNVCGVVGVANFIDGTWGFQMSPTGQTIPKSQTAACTGIAPRAGTIRMMLKHVSGSPHVDNPVPVEGGTFALQNLKLSPTGLAVINSPRPCFYSKGGGRFSGVGLRLDAANYPGSNNLVREDLGNGLWHLHTAPWPNNLAYCEGDWGIGYWHVDMSLHVQILPAP